MRSIPNQRLMAGTSLTIFIPIANARSLAMGALKAFSPTELQLARRALYSLPDAAGLRISCQAGSLWVTLDNDPRDIVLEAGQSLDVDAHRRAIVYALQPSRLRVAPQAASAARADSERARSSRKTTMAMFSRFQAMPLRKAAR
jgi:hypothetical protein